ncbi:MAG: GyrI-like domain-containing protein [Planctomycetota bacterium]|nr:GyrI-like domain-containing protein [Planctomycetota bacterium]
MEPQVITLPLEFTIWGFSLPHDPNRRFGEEIMTLLGRLWPVIKQHQLSNDGLNRVVYDGCAAGSRLFAGLILDQAGRERAEALSGVGLETKTVRLSRYASWKHIGPYHLIPVTGTAMTKVLESRGLRTGWPMVEVYGHWTSDESKLETETLVELR